jgi:cytochrome c oxidase assembly protein subunit 15
VDSLAAPGARLRGFALSPARFRQIAVAAAVMLLVIVATGATVRLTDSGLGCEHWPGCQPGDPFPKKGYHSYVEFSNRIVAFLTILTTLAAWVAALLTPGLRRSTRLLAGAVFGGTLAQAPLGAITVYYDLNPWLVLTHLLLSLVVLAGGTIVALTAFGRPVGSLHDTARWASLLPLAALAVLVVSGTIVTGSGPHPGGADVRRLGAFQDALWLHVRASVVVGVAFVVLVAWAWRQRTRVPWLLPASLAVLGLLLTQMVLGEVQYRTELPWWLVLLHVTVAAAVWGSAVALVASIWRSRATPEIAT